MTKLSVIIPTRNRAKLLRSTLYSIQKQTLNQQLFEVIVCDNNSTDETQKIALSFKEKFINFRYLKTIEPGLHIGRNKGYKEAVGDILVYVDDDIEAFPNWLLTINDVFKDPNIVLVGGKNLPKWEVPPPSWVKRMWLPNELNEKICHFLSLIDLGNEIKEIDPHYVVGCNFSVRKTILDKTKGFHPDGMPQEIIEFRGDGETYISEYIKENNLKTIYHPDASVFHFVSKERLTIDYLRKRGFNQGVSDSYTKIRNDNRQNNKKETILKFEIKSVKKWLKKHLSLIYMRITENDVNYIASKKALLKGYREGFDFHQKKTKNDSRLKAWVLKENYLD